MIYQGSKRYPVNEIIIHASATAAEWRYTDSLDEKIAEITRWHVARGWRTIGYHFVVDRDGKIGNGRRVDEIGAHVKGKNAGTIGICLLGGFGGASDDMFEDHFTPAQRAAVWKLIRSITADTEIKRITGHNRYAAKACPCFEVSDVFPWPLAQKPSGSLFERLMRYLR